MTEDLVQAVTDELLAHGEFSSAGNNRPNAEIAAKAVIDIVRTAPQALAATPGGEYEELANEIKRSDGLFCRVPGIGMMSLGATKTEMVIAALRAQPASPLRGRDREQIAAVLYMTRFPHLTWISAGPTETAFAYKQADAILPLFASPPEQPAAVTGPDNPLRAYSVDQLQFELAIRATWKSPPSKEPELPAAQS